MTDNQGAVSQLRLAITVDDFEAVLAFYRDGLGLPVEATFDTEGRRVAILDAGRATLEIGDSGHAAYIDDLEVGRRVGGPVRVAFEVSDTAGSTSDLVRAGATLLGAPAVTPWNSLNSRLDAPGGLQLTLFEALAPETMA